MNYYSASPSRQTSERTTRRQSRVRAVLARRQPDLTLVLANIHDPHNVSAIYRSCDAFGLLRVHLYYTGTPFPVLSRKTSASARKWVESVRHTNLKSLAEAMNGFQVLCTVCSASAIPLRKWDFTKSTAVIMGNEHSGVDAELLQLSAGQLYIPMHGMIQSFNVSVAAAIILAEAARQREQAGMYDQSRIPEHILLEKENEWLCK